jgi:acyl CoA:acetate/3-ketoacid CoA transferase alpha subunit
MENPGSNISPPEIENKVVDLKYAINKYVKDGMTLYMDNSGAAGNELIRKFWGKQPSFTLVMSLLSGPTAASLIHGGLVKKCIFTNCSDIFPKPTPNSIIQRAYQQKSVELENWTVLSLYQALMAGALNLPFMPTNSVTGTTMAEDNRQSFTVIDDPFGKRKIGIVKALNPDIALVHAWAADTTGNVLMGPFGDTWPIKASREGAIVTVEKIVSTEFIKEHLLFVRLPSYLVKAVCVAPFGEHPHSINGITDRLYPEFKDYYEDSYPMDRNFLQEFRQASEDPKALDKWIQEWILKCKTHNDYLAKLGEARLLELKSKTQRTPKQSHRSEAVNKQEQKPAYNDIEFSVIGAIRKIKETILEHSYKTMFAGVGLSALTGWGAVLRLEELQYKVYMLVPSPIGFGATPRTVIPVGNGAFDLQGCAVGGVNSSCIGIMGTSQIDKYGNMNSTKIGEDTYVAGAGGGGDIASTAHEVVVVARNREDRFMDKVPYITSPGTRVKTLITEDGIFQKEGLEFVLSEYFPRVGISKDERIKQIVNTYGWKVKVSSRVKEIPPPTFEELALLHSLDPDGIWTSK